MEQNQLWIPDVKNWKSVDKESTDLIIKESELGLDAKVKSLESITNRTDKLLSIFIPLFTALSAYLIPKYQTILNAYLATTSFLIICFSAYGMYCCFKNIRPYVVNDLGTYPNKMFVSSYLDNDYNEKEKYLVVAIATLRNIQARIDCNDVIINRRTNNNRKAINMLIVIAFSPLFSFLLIHLKSFLVCHF